MAGGVDEVGRGPWAGPLYVGVVVLDLWNIDIEYLRKNKVRDSKTITAAQREKVVSEIDQFEHSIGTTEALEIDKFGLVKAIEIATDRAISKIKRIDFVLTDSGIKIKERSFKSIIRGDQKCFSIALASILAKVQRDTEMDKWDKIYGGYDFANNKGYGTKKHQQGLQKQGVCPIHRRSFKPVARIIDGLRN